MRHLFVYFLLVGIPGLVLAGALKLGGRLEAPRSIGGEWSVALAGEPAAPLEGLLAADTAGFTIAKSGASFSLSPHGVAASKGRGAMEGGRLRASSEGRHAWVLEATLDAR